MGVANFCEYGILKKFLTEINRTCESKKMQLVQCFYILPFPKYGALKIRNWGRGYALVRGAISTFCIQLRIGYSKVASKASTKNNHK